MTFKWSWRRFLYGMAGALAPEVVRLFELYKQHDIGLPHPSGTLIVVSLVFVMLGGVFASAWGDNNPIKCIYNGVTFPLLISAWITKAPELLPK